MNVHKNARCAAERPPDVETGALFLPVQLCTFTSWRRAVEPEPCVNGGVSAALAKFRRSVAWTGIGLKETGSRSRARSKRSGASSLTMTSNVINGKRDQLEGKLQERYGYAKDQTKKDIDDWYNTQKW
jgi:hypothetical protein